MLLLWDVTGPHHLGVSLVLSGAWQGTQRGAGLLQRALWCWRKQQAEMDWGMRSLAHPMWAQLGFPVLLLPLSGW